MSVLPQSACALKPSLRSTSKPPSTAGGRVTSDGGLVWLAEVDRELGLCESMASDVPDKRGWSNALSRRGERPR